MTNGKLLDDTIKESGLKIGFICDKLGISREAFAKKKSNKLHFKDSEMLALKKLLDMSVDLFMRIFFAENV